MRQAMERLGSIEEEERGGVIEEFFRLGPLVPDKHIAGIELNAPLPNSLSGNGQDAGRYELGRHESNAPPFKFLYEAPPQKLAPFGTRESADGSDRCLHLPAVARRRFWRGSRPISKSTWPGAWSTWKRPMRKCCARWSEVWNRGSVSRYVAIDHRTAGVAAINSILTAANPRARHNILSNLARHDRQLAGKLDAQPRPSMSFADLEHMDSASLLVLMHHAERELLLLALAGAPTRFAERATSLFGEEAGPLRAALCNLGADAAQRRGRSPAAVG